MYRSDEEWKQRYDACTPACHGGRDRCMNKEEASNFEIRLLGVYTSYLLSTRELDKRTQKGLRILDFGVKSDPVDI